MEKCKRLSGVEQSGATQDSGRKSPPGPQQPGGVYSCPVCGGAEINSVGSHLAALSEAQLEEVLKCFNAMLAEAEKNNPPELAETATLGIQVTLPAPESNFRTDLGI